MTQGISPFCNSLKLAPLVSLSLQFTVQNQEKSPRVDFGKSCRTTGELCTIGGVEIGLLLHPTVLGHRSPTSKKKKTPDKVQRKELDNIICGSCNRWIVEKLKTPWDYVKAR
jgi:hypothetical protein